MRKFLSECKAQFVSHWFWWSLFMSVVIGTIMLMSLNKFLRKACVPLIFAFVPALPVPGIIIAVQYTHAHPPDKL